MLSAGAAAVVAVVVVQEEAATREDRHKPGIPHQLQKKGMAYSAKKGCHKSMDIHTV